MKIKTSSRNLKNPVKQQTVQPLELAEFVRKNYKIKVLF